MTVSIDVTRLQRDATARNVPQPRVIERLTCGVRYGDEDHEETVIERMSPAEALALAAVLTAAAGAVNTLTDHFKQED